MTQEAGLAAPSSDAVSMDLVAQFQGIVAEHGFRTALRDRVSVYSYADLDRHAKNIVAHLRQAGINSGDRVAILMEQSAAAVMCVLAVLHAGAVCVPLDNANPPERILVMLEEGSCSALLTDRVFHDIAKNFERTDLPVIVFEDIDRTTDAPLQALPIDPLQPAYIIFTSGTTGRPKGVVQSHAGVLAHIRNYAQNLRIVPEDHLCMLAAYCYDAAVMDMFGALLNGACLSVWNIRREGLEAMERIASEGITIFHSTPTVFRNVLNGTSKAPSHLRLVVLGGERTTRNDVQLFQRTCAANATLVNGLGPTECTIICQAFFTTDSEVEEPVAIGRPVGGLTVSLRDVQDIPVAAGSEGELVVRGAQVALGYFQRPDLTSGAFTDHADGTRSYRTGDIARELPDGQLVFLGRKDGQIKLRGHRIEPAEITNALNAHPDVSDRAVALLEIAGIAALHAWVVPARDRQPDVPALRAHTMALLPDVMVPSTFTTLEKLPLRSNGKLDMGALPAPQWPIVASMNDSASGEPTNHLEKSVALIWQQVLNRTRIGPNDNFFDLGGTSLSGVRIMSRIRTLCGADLPLATLYQAPTIRGLMDRIDRCAEESHWKNLAVIRATGDRIPIVCVHGDEANYHLPRLLPTAHPFLAFFHQGEDGLAIAHTTFAGIARHYVTELLQARPSGPFVMSGFSFGGIIALEMAHQLNALGHDVPLLVIIDSQGPGYAPNPWSMRRALLRMRDAVDRLRCARYLRDRVPIPERLRNFHIMDTYDRAMKTYVARTREQPLFLIRCTAREHEPMGWEGYSADLHSTVIPGDHLSIIRSPDVGRMAQAFADGLRQFDL